MRDYDLLMLGDKKYVSLRNEDAVVYEADKIEDYANSHDFTIRQVLEMLKEYEDEA